MKVITKQFKINVSLLERAAHRAKKGHTSKVEVRDFINNIEERCKYLYEMYESGRYTELLRYSKGKTKGLNGKERELLIPTLECRIYQHLLLELLEPIYKSKDNLVGINCKKGCGMTSKKGKRRSGVHRMKHIYYDARTMHWCLTLDQRKCYHHIKVAVFRKALKQIISDKELIDFACNVCFCEGELPIGTPTSPFVHHVVMLDFDHYIERMTPHCLRYADNVYMAFETKEEAHTASRRIQNYWWYVMGIRAKRGEIHIQSMDKPLDFCGYIFHRTEGRSKGYVTIRSSILKRAKKASERNWGSYFGIMQNSDEYRLMRNIEQDMDLNELTQRVRIDRELDAPHIEMSELEGKEHTLVDYQFKTDKNGVVNWMKGLIAIPNERGTNDAYEFHGNYMGIYKWLQEVERVIPKSDFLPLTQGQIINQCGYIYKGSTNQIKEIKL